MNCLTHAQKVTLAGWQGRQAVSQNFLRARPNLHPQMLPSHASLRSLTDSDACKASLPRPPR